jgi:hypothetical protein
LAKLPVITLLALGVAAWGLIFGPPNPAFISFGSLGPLWLVVFVLVCATFAWLPPTAGSLNRLLQRVKNLSPRAALRCSFAIAGIVMFYLGITAANEHRQLFPYIHDEFSYLIQAHQFATGHLWMPAHPVGEFFDSFQLFAKPVYASAYFPGTALLYVPGVWMHLPAYITSLIVSGAITGLLFWITAKLLDPVWGFLAILLLLSDVEYRQASTLALAQAPLLLYALSATVAWLQWRAKGQLRLVFLTGLFLGLAAVTRPVDALCFSIPIGVAVLLRNAKQSWALVAGAIPLICLQMILNHGITGHWMQTPFGLYADRDYPGTGYGFHPYDPSVKPQSNLPQKQALYREYQATLIEHRPANILRDLLHPHGPFDGARLGLVFSQYTAVPFPLLFPLLPLSLLGLNRTRGVILSGLPLFVLLYIPYVFFFPHYVLSTAPALIIGILLGTNVLCSTWKSIRRFAEVGMTLLIAGSAIAALPQWTPTSDDVFSADLLAAVNQQLAALPHQPAVVLFTYDPKRNTHEEPVYNADVAWPDNAEIIRAHDLANENQKIFNYYAQHQPKRFFYRFDERDRTIQPLGTAKELGEKDAPDVHPGPR